VFPFGLGRQTIALALVDAIAALRLLLAAEVATDLPRTIRELVTRLERWVVALRQHVGERERLGPAHVADGTLRLEATATVLVRAARVRQTQRGPLCLRHFVLLDLERVRQRAELFVLADQRARPLARRGPHYEATGRDPAPAVLAVGTDFGVRAPARIDGHVGAPGLTTRAAQPARAAQRLVRA